MKKLSALIILMTLCLSLVQFGFNSTYANANGGVEPIGPSSYFIESEIEIENKDTK
jgi:hypothetical protein